MASFVAVLPNGHEFFIDRNIEGRTPASLHYDAIASDAVRDAKITQPWREHKTLRVAIYQLDINLGKIVRKLVKNVEVVIPYERLNDTTFETAMVQVLNGLPEEFQNYIRSQGTQKGDNYEEMVEIAEELASDLKEVISKYTHRIILEATAAMKKK